MSASTANLGSPASFAVIALGSNLGDSQAILREAMDQLQALSSAPLLRSSMWETVPVDCPPGSPNFINAVVALVPRPEETPESFLAKLQAMEKEFGRRPKKVMNEPRPLDLDLIAFRNESRNTDQLILPHPRAYQRQFVLCPLNEILPDLILFNGKTVNALLAAAAARIDIPRGTASEVIRRP